MIQNFIFLFAAFIYIQPLFAEYQVENPPQPCECQFAGKDYDPAKGYYFDRVNSKFIPKYDLIGHVEYYETEPVGNFPAQKSSIPEVADWSRRRCSP